MAKKSLLDQIAAAEDVAEELVPVPEWNTDILFLGLTFAAMQIIQGIDLEAAKAGNLDQMVILLQATAADPATRQLIFAGPAGEKVLRGKSGTVLLRLIEKGALVVLGVDKEETAGKGSSSTETEAQATV